MKIDRKLINKEIEYNDAFTYGHLESLINRWKQCLVKRRAKKGDLVAISILNVNHWHVSALFACAELGLRVILLDSPAKKESLPFTKLARFGPARFCLDDGSGDTLYDGLHLEMINQYGGEKISPPQVADLVNKNIQPWEVQPEDDFLISSTSGTTKFSRQITFSHKEVYDMSKRNIDIFKFEQDSVVLHTKNMHHASAMITDLIPSMMVSKKHYNITLADRNEWHTTSSKEFCRFVNSKHVSHMIVPNRDVLKWILSSDPYFENNVLMNMSGFTMGPEYNTMCLNHNISFLQHYGSIDTAIPLLVRYLPEDEDSDWCLGFVPDDYYDVRFNGTRLQVSCDDWTREMGDLVEQRGDRYYFVGRVIKQGNPELADTIPKDLDLTPFYQDTKLNMDQLRGYLDVAYNKKV